MNGWVRGWQLMRGSAIRDRISQGVTDLIIFALAEY